MEKTEFRWNLYSVKLSSFFRDLKAMLHLWKKDVAIVMTKEVEERLKKAATSTGMFEQYGHILFEENVNKNIPFIDIFYDINNLNILAIQTYDGKKKKIYKPLRNVSRQLYLEQRKKRKV